MARKIVDERDARACLKAARAAGTSRLEWARAHGVDARSLNAWRINLARGEGAGRSRPDGMRLVELVPAAPTRSSARYVVRVAGADVEIDDDFREETLVRLVRALRSC